MNKKTKLKHLLKKSGLSLLLTSVILTGCNEEPSLYGNQRLAQEVPVIAPASHRELSTFLSGNEYSWESLDQGVPPFILETLPPDLNKVPEIETKKQLFFLSLLPMVLLVNEEIDQQRQEVLALLKQHDDNGQLDSAQHLRLLDLAREYGLEGDPLVDPLARTSLLKRLDTLPPSMVLAQAANESGYGTSRFALEGNNLFGQWTYDTGSGLIPLERPENESHEVRRFTTLYDSLKAYMKNLNVHRAYVTLREMRALLRERGLDLQGADLAAGLRLYSSRRDAYVSEIRSIIHGNGLARLSSASLHKPLSANPSEEKTNPKKEQKTFTELLAG